MAKTTYIGIDGVARKVKNMYIGIDNVARKIKKAYIGINGIARLFFGTGIGYFGTINALSLARRNVAAASTNNYALFAGGDRYIDDSGIYCSNVDSYNINLVKQTTVSSLSVAKSRIAAVSFNNYIMFAGGLSEDSSGNTTYYNNIEIYDNNLNKTTNVALSIALAAVATTAIENYAIFAGGENNYQFYNTYVNAFDKSFVLYTPTALDGTEAYCPAGSVGGYAIIGGGNKSTMNVYDNTLTRSTIAESTCRGYNRCATTVGNYLLFAGGNTAEVEVYDANLVKNTSIYLNKTKRRISATTLGEYAMFAGGEYYPSYTDSDTVELFDSNLSLQTITPLSAARYGIAATTIANYALFGGGAQQSHTYGCNTVDVYTVQ